MQEEKGKIRAFLLNEKSDLPTELVKFFVWDVLYFKKQSEKRVWNMETVTVYLDVFFLYNLLINLLLLYLTAVSSDRRLSFWKGASAGAAGSVVAVFFMLFEPVGAVYLVLQLPVAAMMVFLAFFPLSFQNFLKLFLLYYLENFMLAGGIYLSGNLWSGGGISVVAVVLGIGVLLGTGSYYACSLKKKAVGGLRMISVIHKGKQTMLRGFADTGNNLTDPFCHASVIVVKKELLSSLISEDEECIRPIPCTTVTGENGLLWGFIPDAVFCENKSLRVVLAASDQACFHDYDAIFNPIILLS